MVEFVGSYTDPRYMALVMSPVAEMDLATYLDSVTPFKHWELRTFFGCLARALQFLHEQSIRHKDIKPDNILVHQGNVLFTDFGLARDFTDASRSTTQGTVNAMTLKYCAPEVAYQEARSTSSDIWSLGVVFLEMVVRLKGMRDEDMEDYFDQHGSNESLIWTNNEALPLFIAHISQAGKRLDNRALDWVRDMLQVDPKSRPTAASLVTLAITPRKADVGSITFCGICCRSGDYDTSSESDEYDDEDA